MLDGISPKPRTLRRPAELVAAGLLPPARLAEAEAVAARYAIAVPPALAALIGAPDDPLGLQYIPGAAELITAPHESADPIADEALSPLPGIVHRYPDRALLKPLLACPVYCRFCFRREQVGPDGGLLSEAELEAAYAYIAAHPGIREVVLTGGDPLILSPRRLGEILRRLEAVPHVELLRIHTRVPVADPAAVSPALLAALETQKPLYIAIHTNHARELTPAAETACRQLARLGIPLLGQSVLLRGVNDSEAALADLFRAMLRARIKPYYLHQLDPAPGTARFYVDPARGREMLRNLRGQISGTAFPTYILDRPGGLGKIPL
ncbi:lysine-2,3-aminomutase-like protein [Acidocella sp. KAb 2-4]|uniref:lysine-2,3-aminomutase-like protein n=1 Tax=Acidocella sp. KAb 2-4 TaxID=2885158 RepID=UPI001D072063|nr:lysine-2,3-aminomutase-like protein [Acidocella sp. KAb 2-4]MCB5945857.1 lysine-2,3-aminomutase-like protein [Acidocella sp. KAb 2-4]